MKDDDPDMLDEKDVTLFVEKFRAAGVEDTGRALDVIEVLIAAIRDDKKEPCLEIARTICEILEPERLGGLISWNCALCEAILSQDDLKNKFQTCRSCRITGNEPGA